MTDQNGTGQNESSPQRDDWQEVSDSFSRLGRMLQDRFTTGGGVRNAEGEVKDAMRSLGEAFNRWGEQVSAAASDPELRDQASRAARAFSTAVGNAFGSVADELSSMMKGQRRARPDEEAWLATTDELQPGDKPSGNGSSASPDDEAPGESKGGTASS